MSDASCCLPSRRRGKGARAPTCAHAAGTAVAVSYIWVLFRCLVVLLFVGVSFVMRDFFYLNEFRWLYIRLVLVVCLFFCVCVCVRALNHDTELL